MHFVKQEYGEIRWLYCELKRNSNPERNDNNNKICGQTWRNMSHIVNLIIMYSTVDLN